MSRTYKSLYIFFIFACVTAIPMAVSAQERRGGPAPDSGRILYHDGSVIGGVPNVYFIWYGDWTGNNTARQILPELIATSGGSPYFKILRTYPDAGGDVPLGGHVFSGEVEDPYSQGSSLGSGEIYEILHRVILNGILPLDNRGIYVVLTSADVDVAGLSTGRCEFHNSINIVGAGVRHVVVPNSGRNPQACASQYIGSNGETLPTPNGDLAADAMANWMVHAINGVITNPSFTGWYDRNGLENSDKCRGMFGQTYLTANGARANISFAGRDYLIQQNWVNDRKGRCALSYP